MEEEKKIEERENREGEQKRGEAEFGRCEIRLVSGCSFDSLLQLRFVVDAVDVV